MTTEDVSLAESSQLIDIIYKILSIISFRASSSDIIPDNFFEHGFQKLTLLCILQHKKMKTVKRKL